MKKRRIVLYVIAMILSACTNQHSLALKATIDAKSCSPINANAGNDMRLELEGRSNELLTSSPDKDVAILNEVVVKYIHPGMTFNCAEEVLKIAGFEVNTDPQHFPPRVGIKHGYLSSSLRLKSSSISSTSVIVNLFGKSDSDLSVITKVQSKIDITTL